MEAAGYNPASLSRCGIPRVSIDAIANRMAGVNENTAAKISAFLGIPESAFFHVYTQCIDKVVLATGHLSRMHKTFIAYLNEVMYQTLSMIPAKNAFPCDEKKASGTLMEELAALTDKKYIPIVMRMPREIYGVMSKPSAKGYRIMAINSIQPAIHTIRLCRRGRQKTVNVSRLSTDSVAVLNREPSTRAGKPIASEVLQTMCRYLSREFGAKVQHEEFINGQGYEHHMARRSIFRRCGMSTKPNSNSNGMRN